MEYLRWVLLSIAVIIVIGVYIWSRSKKNRTSYYSPLNAANDAPSFSAGKSHTSNWVDGVGPVRVARDDNDIGEVLASIKEDVRPGSKLARLRREAMLRNVTKTEAPKSGAANAAATRRMAAACRVPAVRCSSVWRSSGFMPLLLSSKVLLAFYH